MSQESRKEALIADHTLDHLIQISLIDRDEVDVSKPMQQWLWYPAILAFQLCSPQGKKACWQMEEGEAELIGWKDFRSGYKEDFW